MKKYEYVSVNYKGIFVAKTEEHRDIIDKYASMGYRYAGFIPTEISSHGVIVKIDLIFETDI